jgi:hypothetical protein
MAAGDAQVFLAHFDWNEPTATSLHKHDGWELVLVRSGELRSILDGHRSVTRAGSFLDLPGGSIHAIWTESAAGFDVIGLQGLGLTLIVPDDRASRVREIPIYSRDGPWRQDPPSGASYTAKEDLDRWRRLSQTLFLPEAAASGS